MSHILANYENKLVNICTDIAKIISAVKYTKIRILHSDIMSKPM
jgi:hypothetical protein